MLDEIGPAYAASHLARSKRPRDYVLRPVRIACQNVIVGLAAIAQDASFDGLAVAAWQTCDVPHVAAHEANRALAALTLCDAFRSGGTMEIRFDRPAHVSVDGKQKTYAGHPEGRVPASLRRFGRTVGLELGLEDPAAITPAEARDLFLQITPMPQALPRARVDRAVAEHGLGPERICFTLLSQVWHEIELEFLLAASGRPASILQGGASWTDRAARQAEADVCRAALMAGMLFRRLNSTDAAGADGAVRLVEDATRGVTWTIDDELGAVRFDGLAPAEPLPWSSGNTGAWSLLVAPRSGPAAGLDGRLVERADGASVALLLPADQPAPAVGSGVAVLRCPDRLADLDKAVEAKLLSSRISRG